MYGKRCEGFLGHLFPPLPVLFSLSVRTGWTGFEMIPSIQPPVFFVFF